MFLRTWQVGGKEQLNPAIDPYGVRVSCFAGGAQEQEMGPEKLREMKQQMKQNN